MRIPPYAVKTVADFTVGQKVTVLADQGTRHGTVTKLGRTRVTISHPRNKAGVMVERAYPMGAIIVGRFERKDDRGTFQGWKILHADGYAGDPYGTTKDAFWHIPVIVEPPRVDGL